ncbi:MAG TPA: hypothetical protein VIF09_23495 [Polyangiaceae bacterium]
MGRSVLVAVAFALSSCHASASTSSDAGLAVPQATSSISSPADSTPSRAPVGTPNVPVPPPPSTETYPFFRKTTVPAEQLAKLVAAAPELARVGTEVELFDPADGSYILRSTADRQGVSFSSQPLLWSPETGQQILVVAGRGKTASFVAAWWLLPDGTYRLASTFVMLGEVAPVALAYRSTERTLWWTSCWQCPGETGHVSVRDDHHVVIVQD